MTSRRRAPPSMRALPLALVGPRLFEAAATACSREVEIARGATLMVLPGARKRRKASSPTQEGAGLHV